MHPGAQGVVWGAGGGPIPSYIPHRYSLIWLLLLWISEYFFFPYERVLMEIEIFLGRQPLN